MPYRDAEPAVDEVVESYDVSISKGGEVMALFGALSGCCLVALAISVFVGTPPGMARWVWTLPCAAGILAVPAIALFRHRRRKLLIVRTGRRLRLVVGTTELQFPLQLSGDQLVWHTHGLPMHHLHLKLVDADGRGILLTEVRGAAHGAQDEWFTAVAPSTPVPSFGMSGLGDAVKVRDRVSALNIESK